MPSGLLITIKSSSSKIIAFFISFSIFAGKFLKLLSLFSDSRYGGNLISSPKLIFVCALHLFELILISPFLIML